MRPNAVPKTRGGTSRLVSGHITAGTSEKLTPMRAVAIQRLQFVYARIISATGSRNAPKASNGA